MTQSFCLLQETSCKAQEVDRTLAPSASYLFGSMADSATLVRPPCDPFPLIAAGLSAHLVGVPLTQAPTSRTRMRKSANDGFAGEAR